MRLCLNGITVAFGDKEVLNNIKFEVNSKDKVALIGRNGSGKTTLLKVVTGEQEINLDSIVPSETMYEYDFSVSNYNEEKRLETNAKYNIIIRTTTNLNLEYYLYENDNLTDILIDRQFIQDEDGTYFYIMKTNDEYFSYKENQSNNYTLKIKFPIEYISSEYQDIRESIEIIINSSQVVD